MTVFKFELIISFYSELIISPMPGFEPESSRYEADSIPMCYRASVGTHALNNRRCCRHGLRPILEPFSSRPFMHARFLTCIGMCQ